MIVALGLRDIDPVAVLDPAAVSVCVGVGLGPLEDEPEEEPEYDTVGEPLSVGDMRVDTLVEGEIVLVLDTDDERVEVPDTDRDLEEVMEREEVGEEEEERDWGALRVPVAHATLEEDTDVVEVGDLDCVTVFVWIAEDVDVFVVVGQGVPAGEAVDVREEVEEAVLVDVIRGVPDLFTLALTLGLALDVRDVLTDFVPEGEADDVRDCRVDAEDVPDVVEVLELVTDDVPVLELVAVRVEEMDAVDVRVVVADLETDVDAVWVLDRAAERVDVMDLYGVIETSALRVRCSVGALLRVRVVVRVDVLDAVEDNDGRRGGATRIRGSPCTSMIKGSGGSPTLRDSRYTRMRRSALILVCRGFSI